MNRRKKVTKGVLLGLLYLGGFSIGLCIVGVAVIIGLSI